MWHQTGGIVEMWLLLRGVIIKHFILRKPEKDSPHTGLHTGLHSHPGISTYHISLWPSPTSCSDFYLSRTLFNVFTEWIVHSNNTTNHPHINRAATSCHGSRLSSMEDFNRSALQQIVVEHPGMLSAAEKSRSMCGGGLQPEIQIMSMVAVKMSMFGGSMMSSRIWGVDFLPVWLLTA